MEHIITKHIAGQLGLSVQQVRSTIDLFDEGSTVPFIARYRKERTGGLDEVQIGAVKEAKGKMEELLKRRETILRTIEEAGQLADTLKERIEACFDPIELEDIYLPFKPKRRTRASMAMEKGLEPLAKIIFAQRESNMGKRVAAFLNDKVTTTDEALAGACDIAAQWISEDERARNIVRRAFATGALIRSKVVREHEEEGAKYRDYFDWEEPLKRCPSHRFLAMRRGENEGFLKITIAPADSMEAVERLKRLFVRYDNECGRMVSQIVEDSYKRLIAPSIATEVGAEARLKADKEAIRVFAANMRQLLLAPPLGQQRVLAIDPGFRTGCKVVCLDAQGTLLHNETIYPHKPQEEIKQAARKLTSLIESYNIEAIAVGNGTAGRETETFLRRLRLSRDVKIFVVSEDGASVYSASHTAREEFPQYDVTVRGAVSIGRRLMDPLAELVKIEPKSIGVGQYQHDVDQKLLKESLDGVVASCVNTVGVNVNTASMHLLTHISGLGPQLARNIVDYRTENGPFASRKELMKVPRMGAKAFEQSAGFLRIAGAGYPLDNSAVHPESYHIVEKIADDLRCSLTDLMASEALQKQIKWEKYADEKTGLPTLNDIKAELLKPGLDPRNAIKVFEFAGGIFSVSDLRTGMVLPGIVSNITQFGVFVDIGVKQDGLVHISQLANRYVGDPNEIVSLHQHVKVKVVEVDMARNRIQLSMKDTEQLTP